MVSLLLLGASVDWLHGYYVVLCRELGSWGWCCCWVAEPLGSCRVKVDISFREGFTYLVSLYRVRIYCQCSHPV
jgi:hypothetical protein